MLAPYDYCKDIFKHRFGFEKERSQNLASAAVSGFFAALMALPFDYMKTKLQKMKPNHDGTLPYNGLIDAFRKTIAKESFLGLWRGFPVFYVRIAPPVMTTLILTDWLKQYF